MNNRGLKKVLNKMLLSAGSNLTKDYSFLISINNNTNIKSYKGFNIYKYALIRNNTTYLTEFKQEDLYFKI